MAPGDSTGITRHGSGWRATVSQGRNRPLIRRHFPLETDWRVMQEWRADVKARLRLTRKQRATMGSFAADARRYLAAVTALPTYKERQREIALWVDVFGTQQRSQIDAADIRMMRDRWLTEPRDGRKAPPLAPGTVNKRLRALSNLFRVLDGPGGSNPVRSVPEAAEPAPEAKALDYDTIGKILAALPDTDRADKGQKRGKVSLTKIRLHCLAYCPITSKQLGQLTPADLDLERGFVRMPARHKGAGARAIWAPLIPPALAAFRAFDAANAYGKFSRSSLRQSFQRAARKAGVTVHVWPYLLRHSLATLMYRATGSLEAVGAFMQHKEASTTRRYALSAEADVMAANRDRIALLLTPAKIVG
jgi:integrase